jgi:hypothetical protein
MARIYSNENFPQPIVEELRRLGHDVLTTHEAGNSGQAIPDEDVLAYAVSEARAIVTLNRKHFVRLHQRSPKHCGILVCTFDADFIALARRIHTLLEAQNSLADLLLRVNRPDA